MVSLSKINHNYSLANCCFHNFLKQPTSEIKLTLNHSHNIKLKTGSL